MLPTFSFFTAAWGFHFIENFRNLKKKGCGVAASPPSSVLPLAATGSILSLCVFLLSYLQQSPLKPSFPLRHYGSLNPLSYLRSPNLQSFFAAVEVLTPHSTQRVPMQLPWLPRILPKLTQLTPFIFYAAPLPFISPHAAAFFHLSRSPYSVAVLPICQSFLSQLSIKLAVPSLCCVFFLMLPLNLLQGSPRFFTAIAAKTLCYPSAKASASFSLFPQCRGSLAAIQN